MSDFDKEAERERLREKYEDDRRDRQSTRRMSELLLKGATMTDRHCEECGDPVFSYDGQVFCPTCQGEQAPGAAEQDGAAAAAETAADPESGPQDQTGDGDGAEDDAVQVSTPADDARAAAPTDRPAADESAADARPQTTDAGTGTAADADAGGRASARASLERTLVRFAREAEAAEDPRRARDLLAAAREAAETLSALDQR